MPYRKNLKTKAKSSSGDIQEFVVEFQVHETRSLDQGNDTSYFPMVVLINNERVSVAGNSFINPSDGLQYELLV
ncbi:hypothetical protein [Acinetobacter bereziniae]|uniref:hypothetical protein n=1 Tax=Acinetobacter bereziniae TaxID=106648 RepID=UPI003AF7704C